MFQKKSESERRRGKEGGGMPLKLQSAREPEQSKWEKKDIIVLPFFSGFSYQRLSHLWFYLTHYLDFTVIPAILPLTPP